MTGASGTSIAWGVIMTMATFVCAADLPPEVSGVASVFDGDTRDAGSVTVRLRGVDAPEAG